MFKQIWDRISINGIHTDMSIDMQKNVILTNQFAFTWFFIIIPYIGIFLFTDIIGAMLLGFLCIIHVVVLLLNSIRLFHISRLLEGTIPQFIIFLLAALVYNKPLSDRLTSFISLNLAFLTIPFLIYSLREYYFIIISIAFSICCFLFFDSINYSFQLPFSSNLYSQQWFELFNYFVAVGMLIIGFTYLKAVSDQYLERVNTLLTDAKDKNELLKKKNYEISKQRDIIFYQNKEIISSIEYASYIQKALFPSEVALRKAFPKSFIYYRPKEQVGGDFYWFEHYENKSIIIAGDCTGHGVPGGFLSMLAIAYLDEIIIKNNQLNPADILNNLREKFIATFQTDNQYGNKDGVDLAIIIIDKEKHTLQFSGAINGCYIIRENELNELKGNKISVGTKHLYFEGYETKEFQLNNNDYIVLFSDGYIDQFGGPSNKRYQSANFKDLMTSMSDSPIEKHSFLLNKNLEDWISGHEQIDDILILGLKYEQN